jgi:hypothetical protein
MARRSSWRQITNLSLHPDGHARPVGKVASEVPYLLIAQVGEKGQPSEGKREPRGLVTLARALRDPAHGQPNRQGRRRPDVD